MKAKLSGLAITLFINYLMHWLLNPVTSSLLNAAIKELVYPDLLDCAQMQRTLLKLDSINQLDCQPQNDSPIDSYRDGDKLFYYIKSKDNEFMLQISRNNEFLSPSFSIEERFGDLLHEGVNINDIKNCFYQGVVLNVPRSHVVVNVCGGLSGVITLHDNDLYIQPQYYNTNVNTTSKSGHVLSYQKITRNDEEKNVTNCGNAELYKDQPKRIFHQYKFQFNSDEEVSLVTAKSTRHRRSVSLRRYVELMVVADESMFEFYGRNEIELRRYLLSVMAIVTSILKDSTIGNFVDVSVVKLLILKKNPAGFTISSNAEKSLRKFNKWQKQENKPSRDDPEHFDAAILVTRKNLCSSSNKLKCDTLGLAELGSVCDPYRSSAIVEDNGLSVAFTIAHEIGHLINAPHDGEDNGCTGENVHIMTPSFSIRSKTWTWSSCSRNAITDFLDSTEAQCLLDKPSPRFEHPLPLKLPGEMFSMDKQCKLVYGENSSVCPFARQCDRLWCIKSVEGRKSCHTNNMPWADGTKCARKSWCMRGKCQKKEKLTPVHGEWGEWSTYGECSRPCGGGIKFSERKCSSPVPANNGRYCVGKRQRYKSCNTQWCKGLKKSFRASQCEAFNGKNLGIPGVPSSVKWFTKSRGIKTHDRCKLFCAIKGKGFDLFYELASKVIDGTKCQKGLNDICVDGKCEPAGCDNVLGSKAKVDNCGKCNGDNSTCRTYYGKKNGTRLGYNFVVSVPRGASRLKVVQRSSIVRKHDTNFLALLDQRKEYVFNGEWRVSLGKRRYSSFGTSIFYSGPNSQNETIWIPGTLLTNVEIRVLSVSGNPACNIEYSYNYPVRGQQKYAWSLKKSWSECFPVCRGYQVKEYECQREIDLQVVSYKKCDGIPPEAKVRKCNKHCELRWEVYQSECVPIGICGNGVQEQKISCMLIQNENSLLENQTLHHKDCRKARIGQMPPKEVPCYTPCTSVRWVYTPWSQCNATCGGGSEQRSVQCIDQATRKPVEENNCNGTRKAPLTRQCNLNQCPKWHTGAWSGVCSVTCGHGFVERLVYCVVDGQTISDNKCDNSTQPERTQPCRLSSCSRWISRAWSKCSRSCGQGHQIREVHCESEVGEHVSEDTCNEDEKPSERRKCFIKACQLKAKIKHKDANEINSLTNIRWLTGLWGECSQSCGRGNRERVVACVSNNVIVGDSQCIPSKKPLPLEECNVFACPFWRYGQWSECTKPCDNGTQTRLVLCGYNGTIVTDDYCSKTAKPNERRFCNEQDCEQVQSDSSYEIDNEFADGNWELSRWSKCSTSCGFGVKKREVSCIGRRCRSNTKPIEVTSCNSGACPGWNYGQWTPCHTLKSCGAGWQARLVVCQMEDGQVLQDVACDINYKPVNNRTCELEPCQRDATWMTTPWQPCNVACGNGLSFRYISCEDTQGNTLPEARCLSFEGKPKQKKPCQRSLCPKWYAETWEQCDSTCTQRRRVKCKRGEELIDQNICKLESKPLEERECENENCIRDPVYRWHIDAWSRCSKTCGYSLRSRRLSCLNDEDRIVNPTNCRNLKNKPTVAEKCFAGPCPPDWVAQPWGECSFSCGIGKETRVVTCQDVDGKVLSDRACDGSNKLPTTRICNLGYCDNVYRWVAGPWIKCSQSCGVGETRRDVQCVNKQNITQNFNKCNQKHQPGNMKVCNTNNCPQRTCRDVKRDLSVTFDGEQILEIGNQTVLVYCEGMHRSNPKEFITLKTDPKENYSEIYGKRLRKKNVCPDKGRRQIPCKNCIDYTASGITYFKKIRIDIRKMTIVPEDKTFADQFGRNPPGFASAGDCYSNAKCPQGRFMVNLSGTGLSISHDVTWVSRGYSTSQKIRKHKNNQIIYGTCGGYCGMCSPSYQTGLKVDITSEVDNR